MQAASHVIVVVPCAKCACRWRTSGASSSRSASVIAWMQLLDVDLARAGERRAAVAEAWASAVRARARTPCGRRRRQRRSAGGTRAGRAQRHAVQRLRQPLRVRQVLRLRLDRVEHRVPVPLLALLDRLDDVQPQRHAGLLDPVDLGRDERLGDPREPHQDVGDGPVHTLVTTRRARTHALEESLARQRLVSVWSAPLDLLAPWEPSDGHGWRRSSSPRVGGPRRWHRRRRASASARSTGRTRCRSTP